MTTQPNAFEAHFARSAARMRALIESDPDLRALVPDAAVSERLQTPGLSLQQVVATVLAGYADRPALGTRDYDVVTDADGEQVRRYLPAYHMLSYGDLRARIEAVANFWRIAPAHRVASGDMVAFLAFSGAEMAAVDLAGIYADAVVVPLQANAPESDLDVILQDTAPVTMVASLENLALAVDLVLRHPSIRSLMVIDIDLRVDAERRALDAARSRLGEAGGKVALVTLDEAIDEGARHAFEPLPSRGPDNMMMIMYTSGSTGTPKGAMIHEGIVSSTWTSRRAAQPVIAFMFAPLNHFMGRNMLYSTLAQGGTGYFTLRSDLATLLEDIRLARPTSLGLIPRIAELVQQHYLSEVQRKIAEGEDADAADRAVRAEMGRTFLGDRLVSCTIGSAPTTPELRQFLSDLFDVPVSDGYGNTEIGGGGITFNNRIVTSSVTDFKLIDVPELGYYTSDKPFPRGELLIKTGTMIKGYYKRPEASAAIFDPDGFLKTGDIMEQRGPDHLVWLDRRNNVMKLSQGEYVAIGPLESTYLGHSKLIDQIYLYGSSQRAFLLAVVVPNLALAGASGQALDDDALRRLVLEDLRQAAATAGLKSFEIPRDVLIERDPFTIVNGLLSGVGKPLRPKLKHHYGDALEAMYQEIDRQHAEELKTLRSLSDGRPTVDRVADALRIHLGLAELEPSDTASYLELGGDSLGAVNFALLLEDMFGVSVPVSQVLHPTASAARLAADVEALLDDTASAARYDVIHPDQDRIQAKDLTLEAVLGEPILRAAQTAAPPVDRARTVLLTGANGFLGRFLCLAWLEALAAVDGKLICLLRGADAVSARKRLDDAIGTHDPELRARFEALAERHLEILPGDLAASQLGLGAADFARLAREVDQIVHPAALVNHRLAYRNLFEPNVMGTAELLRLALTDRLKRFDYVSTIAVVHTHPALSAASEDADIRKEAPSVLIGADHYAVGYAASKWAGEVMMREAHDRFGLPVNVFRADMILPHARYSGQVNVPDVFTRLLLSIVMTGLAPCSFYQPREDGSPGHVPYDGLPVNFVADAMQQIGAAGGVGYHSYNFSADAGEGASLDDFVAWMTSAGYDVARVEDYDDWLARFTEKLRNLPDEQRNRSSLSVIGALQRPQRTTARSPVSTDRFVAAVRGIGAGPDVPRLSEAYIHKCLQDMAVLGLIPRPALVAGN